MRAADSFAVPGAERIGALAVTRGIGGLFPWMLNYDSSGSVGGCVDNSLFQWMRQGMLTAPGNKFSPLQPSTSMHNQDDEQSGR
jgi:hypothetical protein